MDAFELLTYAGARELFDTLRNYPKRQFSINELSKTARLPFTTTWKLVQKFDRSQLVETTLIGRSRAVQFKESPYSKLVASMLRMSKSYQALSLPELKRIIRSKGEIRQARMFGSMAIKKERLESDIDVALLLEKQIDTSSFMTFMIEKYGVKVIPITFFDQDEYEDFLKEKKTVVIK